MLRREDATSPVGRLVGGDRNVGPLVIGAAVVVALLLVAVLLRRRGRRHADARVSVGRQR
jgi:hypothetical protein